MRKANLLSSLVILAVLSTSCEKQSVPSLTTNEAKDITYSSAIVGGDITSDGNEMVTARGVVWGENQNPTLSDSFTVDEINTTGAFSDTLMDLAPSTTYYVRAYATNSQGTGYGNQISFTTEELTNFFTYKGNTYELSIGLLEYYGQWSSSSDSYNFDIVLFSSGFSYNHDADDLTGEGHLMYFEMFSSSSNDLMPGTYLFDIDETYAANTFGYGFFAADYILEDETYSVGESIWAGSVEVSKTGSVYNITIDCADNEGNPVTGYFSGDLFYNDWSGDWSKSTKDQPNKGFRFSL